jgi:hypothetical protein
MDQYDASSESIVIVDPGNTQTADFAPTPWTPKEVEHYRETGETPLARLHRENLAAQWSDHA